MPSPAIASGLMAEYDDNSAVIICFTRSAMPVPHTDDSREANCSACNAEIWISDRTRQRVAETSPDLDVVILCVPCALGVLDNDEDVEWVLTAEQEKLFGGDIEFALKIVEEQDRES